MLSSQLKNYMNDDIMQGVIFKWFKRTWIWLNSINLSILVYWKQSKLRNPLQNKAKKKKTVQWNKIG